MLVIVGGIIGGLLAALVFMILVDGPRLRR
jgi:hypothetical protein